MKLFERTAKVNDLVCLSLALAASSAWFQPAVAGSDLWWHLASGREIWARGGVPSTDIFSFTFAGREWLNHEWLWDALLWPLYETQPQLVAWAQLALLFAVATLTWLAARRYSGSRLAAGVTVWLGCATSHWFFDIRPHVTTLALVALLLVIREKRFAPYCWPPLVAVWANLHSGFVFGVGAIGLDVLVRGVQESWNARRLVVHWRDVGCVALSILAMLANPWGYRILAYPLKYLDGASPYRLLVEWLPPPFGLDPSFFQTRFWAMTLLFAAGGVVALRSSAQRRDGYLLALPLVTLMMATTSRRFIPLFCVTAAPAIAIGLAAAWNAARDRLPGLRRPAFEAVLCAGALTLAGVSWQGVRLTPDLLSRWTEADLYPGAALRYLHALGPPERVLNHYNWGGFLMLHAPTTRTFIDGRANTLYDDRMYHDYRAMLAGDPRGTTSLARYPAAEVALVPPGPLAESLKRLADPWTVAYDDGTAVVLLPPGSPLRDRAPPASVVGDHPQWRLAVAGQTAFMRQIRSAIELLEELVADEPLLVPAWGRLADFYARVDDFEAAGRTIERGIAWNPRRAEGLRHYEARAYLQRNELERALPALRASMVRGPFGHPEGTRQEIAALERMVQARGKR